MNVILLFQIFENRDYIQTHCNNRRNTFHFACHQWVYLHEFKYKY